MIDIDRLMQAVEQRTTKWALLETFTHIKDAKKAAAKAYIATQGAMVVKYVPNRYAVYVWKRRPYNGD